MKFVGKQSKFILFYYNAIDFENRWDSGKKYVDGFEMAILLKFTKLIIEHNCWQRKW